MPAIESNSSSELIFQNFAKGLSGHFLSERTSAVCSSPQLIRDNPTPFFVNKVVVQLSSLFKDDAHNANVVRFAIVNALAECKAQLAHVFSTNSIIDNVLVVSHSTDIEARSLTLQMFASLAPVAKDNKKVHHLVVESLLSSHIEEFSSAIIALKEYVKLSTGICDMVVDRMSMMLLSQLTPEERKKQLISVIGSMRSSLQTTQSMFAVCIRLIKDEVLIPEHSEMLMDSMTDLAIATRFTIPDQISFLLDELVNCKITSFYICALRNIRHLAHHAHMWDKEAIEKLCHRQSVLPSAPPLLILEYLRVLEVIAKNALPNHIDHLKNSVIDLSSYYGHTHLAVRISFMSLSTTVLAIGPVNSQHMKLLLNAFLATLPLEMEKGLLKKLCRASIHLIRDCGIEQTNLWELLGLICSLPSNHQSLGVFLELFAQLSDTMTEVVAPIAEWADKMIQKGEAHLSTETLAFLVFSKDQEITRLADEWTKNDWIAYRVALLAMRTGHLRDVAFPLFEQIDRQNLSPSSLSWIQILRLICLSQPKEFSIAEVDKATESLRQANQIIKKLVIGSFGPKFLFVSRFITSFLSTQMIYGILLGGLGHFLVGTELLTNQEACEKALQVLKVAQRYARSAVEMWGSLSKTCFAADTRSLDAFHMLGSTASLLNYGLQAIISNEEPAPVKIPLLDSTCTVRFRQRQLLEWAKTNFEMLTRVQTSEAHRVNEQSINHLMTVAKSLCMHRLGMPKYLFYQKCQLEIKLSVTPGTSGEYHASPNTPIPFKVTGLILTKGPIVSIETVIVTAIVQFAASAGNDYEQSQTVNLKEKDYFNANFLLQFNQNCSVHFSVEFFDSERRQNWKSEANTMVRIQVRTPARIEH